MTEGSPPTPVLSCRSTTIRIADVVVTRDLDLDIETGQCWCILGRNGVGKTTLLHALAGLQDVVSGTIRLHDKQLGEISRRHLAQQISILFQTQEDAFPASVLETVLQGRHPHLHSWQWESATDIGITRRALKLVGLEGLAQRNVQTLSGGERQRAAIATLIAQDTELLLLDEPTNHLDLRHRIEILDKLVTYCRDNGKALVMVLHDINLAARFADRVLLLLGDGRTYHGARQDVLRTDSLELLYGHPLAEVETRFGPAWLPA